MKPAKYRDFNRQLVEILTGNLWSFQPATCGLSENANGKNPGKTIDRFGVLYPGRDSGGADAAGNVISR